MFGLPVIIHSDNGIEFVNKLIEDVVSTGQLINGHICDIPSCALL